MLAHADFDEDGLADVAAIDAATDVVRVFAGIGAGEIDTTGVDVATPGVDLRQVGVGDLDDDGSRDLVVTGATSADVTVLRGLGDGTFDLSEVVTVCTPGFSIATDLGPLAVADLDLDGRDDVASFAPFPSRFVALVNHTYGAGSPFLDLGEQLPGTNGYPLHL